MYVKALTKTKEKSRDIIPFLCTSAKKMLNFH